MKNQTDLNNPFKEESYLTDVLQHVDFKHLKDKEVIRIAIDKIDFCISMVRKINENNLKNEKINQRDIFFINEILLHCSQIQAIIVTYKFDISENPEKNNEINLLLDKSIKAIDSAIENRTNNDFNSLEFPELKDQSKFNDINKPYFFVLGFMLATAIFCLFITVFFISERNNYRNMNYYQDEINTVPMPEIDVIQPNLIEEKKYER